MQGMWSILRLLNFILRRVASHCKLLSKRMTQEDLGSQRSLWLLCGNSSGGEGKRGKWGTSALTPDKVMAA